MLVLVLVTASWVTANQPAPSPAAAAAASASSMLTVDSIMRGPKLVGAAPTNVRWSKDSSQVYFSWQKPGEARASTYAVQRNGEGLRPLSTEEARGLDVMPSGRFDAAHRRLLAVESGDVALYDATTGARRQITRTSAAESNPRWARNGAAVTFVREGNLYLVSLDAAPQPAFVQLTDVVPAPDGQASAAPAAGQRGAGGRGGGRGAAAQAAQSGAAGETASQRVLREEEMKLIDHLTRQADEAGRGGGRGGIGGPPSEPIARVQLGPRQTLADLQLSGDEKFVWMSVTEAPAAAARGQMVANYVTASAYPEIIQGRPDVGDVQARRLLASLDLKSGKTAWADASAFAGFERKAAPGDPDVPRVLDWSMPDVSDDGAQSVVAVRSQDNKDRWFVKVDPSTGKATPLDDLHDDAWIREQGVGAGANGAGTGVGIAWLPDNRRFLFLSEKTGWMQLYAMDVTEAEPKATPLTTGAWEVSDARLSADRQTVFLTTNQVHPGERQFYTMPSRGGALTRVTSMTGGNDVTVSPDEQTLAIVYSYSTKPPELYLMPFRPGAAAVQVTTTPTDEWRSFKWIDPRVITYPARDGALVYAAVCSRRR